MQIQIPKFNLLVVNRHPSKRISHHYLKTKIKTILRLLNLVGSTLQVTLASDAVVRRQNKIHRNLNHTTDVLSFPSLKPQKFRKNYQDHFLGDILISLDQAAKQARLQSIKFEHEVLFLIVHSILHLIGFDHTKIKDTHKMQKLESELWRKIL